MTSLVLLISILIILSLMSLGLILFGSKMTDDESDRELIPQSNLPTSASSEFDEALLMGGLRFPISMTNRYRTCFIDSVLNSIVNSDVLVERFKNIVPEKSVSDDQIEKAFTTGLKDKRIVSSIVEPTRKAKNNRRELYAILCCIFMRGIDKYSKSMLQYIRTYILYLDKMNTFNPRFSNTKPVYAGKSFYEYVCATDYNFIIYFNYCKEMYELGNDNVEFTGVLDNRLIKNLGLLHVIRECTEDDIQTVLSKCTDSDMFIEIHSDIIQYDKPIIKKMIATCTKKHEGPYRCTDIIFDMYERNEDEPYHSVYYNLDEKVLHDDAKIISNVNTNVFESERNDGDYYVPCIIHFQRGV